MLDGQWRLVYPGVDYLWDSFGKLPVFNQAPVDFGDAEVRSQDVSQPHSDGDLFGRDFRGGRTITFDLAVNGPDEEVHDRLDELATVWDADAIRRQPGGVAELRCAFRGRERVAYGRPRRFATDVKHVFHGVAGAVADFQTVDHRFYSVGERQVSTGLAAATGGGLVAPLASPLATTGDSDRSVIMDVDSQYPVWPVITIEGPITDPEVEILGVWRVKLRTTLAYDETLTVDTRPWRRAVTIDPGGRSARGAFTRDSVRLTSASVPPGRHEVAFRGRTSGAPSMTVRWQSAHAAP